MKSQVNALLHVTRGILKDVSEAYPAMLSGCLKDLEMITLQSKTRGLGFFTLDLPALEPLLLEGLETGLLRLEGPLSRRVSKSVNVPRLFSGLWLSVFDDNACLKHEVDVTCLFFLRQLLTIGKKLAVECSSDRIEAVMENYYDVEGRISKPTLGWECDDLYERGEGVNRHCGDLLGPDPASLRTEGPQKALWTEDSEAGQAALRPLGDVGQHARLLDRIQQVADLIIGDTALFLPEVYSDQRHSESGASGFKHGVGAVAERVQNHLKSDFKTWPAKLQGAFPWEACGKTAGNPKERPLNHELASRLLAVPKTAKGPRLIASEPVSHMWCQQLTLDFLNKEIKRLFRGHFIDFRSQHKSAAMVLEASRNRKLATVDLSDASDRLSCWLVERVFRSNPSILFALHASRTRLIRDEISDEMNFIKLKKFAAQGTAVTFPVQSLVFLCIAIGASLSGPVTWKNIWKLRAQVRVYGDDIIVPVHGYASLCTAMGLLGLKVNARKSFVKGSFRESCGADGYMGYDVTPVKPKHIVADSPESTLAVIDTINNLFSKGLWNASDSLRASLPLGVQQTLRVVGPLDSGVLGFASYVGSDETHLVKRWNKRLHRDEVRVRGILPRTRKGNRGGYETLLEFFSSSFNHEQARVKSEYVSTRNSTFGVLWEPSCTLSHMDAEKHQRPSESWGSPLGDFKTRLRPSFRL